MYQNIKLYTLSIYNFYVKNISIKLLGGGREMLGQSGCFESTTRNTNRVPLEVGKIKKELPGMPLSFPQGKCGLNGAPMSPCVQGKKRG